MSKKQFLSIFLRELSAYFNSPIAYIFMVVFLLMTCSIFMTNFFILAQADMRSFFDILPLILCVFIPALTMRLWAEDKKGNTFELLLTFPVPSWKLVIGKFLAAFVFYLLSLAGTVLIPFMLYAVGTPDIGPILGGYLGAVFLGVFLIALGAFISALCLDQIVAFILTMVISFFFFMIGWESVASVLDSWALGAGTLLTNAFSAGKHLTSFAKGVLVVNDIFYFLSATIIFLILNILAVEDRLRKGAKLYFMITAIFGTLLIACVNVFLTDISIGRFDMTQARVFTITPATKKILKTLDAPVIIKLYITPQEKMPTAFKSLEQDIRGRLDELKTHSNGRLQYRVIRMEVPDATAKEDENSLSARLEKKGITPIAVKSIDKDEVGVKLIYSSIALSYKNKDEEFIPRVLPDRLAKLEYNIIAKIYRMMQDKKLKVALFAPYQEKKVEQNVLDTFKRMGQPLPAHLREDSFKTMELLLKQEGFDVKRIRLNENEPIADDIDLLIGIPSDNLTPRQRYEIDRYLYTGGNVVLAEQYYTYEYKQNQFGTGIFPKKKPTQINDFLKTYGLRIDERMLMDEHQEVINVSGNAENTLMSFTAPVKAPIQITIPYEQISRTSSMTNGVASLFYLWGSALRADDERIKSLGLKKTILFTSSSSSWLVEQKGAMLTKEDIVSRGRKFTGKDSLAILLEGQFPLSFADEPPPAWDLEYLQEPLQEFPEEGGGSPLVVKEKQKIVREEKPLPGKLLLIGCSKMFEDSLLREGGSLDLLTNIVDAFLIGGDLIQVRSQQTIQRNIKQISSKKKLFFRFIVIFMIPISIVLFGLSRFILRKREKQIYLRKLQ